MKQIQNVVISVIILLTLATLSHASTNGNVKSAREVVRMWSEGKYSEMISMFDSTMKKAAPEDRLHAIWTSLLGQTGKFKEVIGDSSFQYAGYDIVLVTCNFEKSTLDVKVVFDKEGKIAGLFFVPHSEASGQPEKTEGGKTKRSEPSSSFQKVPYVSGDVTFNNLKAGVSLAGTLTLPDSTGKFPAVLLISGSGPNDRNESVAGHEIFRALADYLTRRGIAVLRYDKRGIGKSTGVYAAATTMDFASDALAGVNYLSTLKQVDRSKIGLIGHSEGGEIAPVVADESPDVSFVVLMAGPGVSGYKTIMSQLVLIDRSAGLSDSVVKAAAAVEKNILQIVMTEKDSTTAAAKLRRILETQAQQTSETADVSIKQLLSPWYRFFLAYDPVPALKKVKCPVLALWGSKDLQVPPAENMSAVKKALKSGGNKHSKVVEIPGLNHLFQEAKTGSPLEYASIKETISPKALDIIAKWILKETERGR